MSRLRAYRMNGGKIIDLLKYQEGKKKREVEFFLSYAVQYKSDEWVKSTENEPEEE